MYAYMPQVTGADNGTACKSKVTDEASFAVSVQERIPTSGDRVFKAATSQLERPGKELRQQQEKYDS